MNQKEALTVLMRRHMPEFKSKVSLRVAEGYSRASAKSATVTFMVKKYNEEYKQLRGKNLKGGL